MLTLKVITEERKCIESAVFYIFSEDTEYLCGHRVHMYLVPESIQPTCGFDRRLIGSR